MSVICPVCNETCIRARVNPNFVECPICHCHIRTVFKYPLDYKSIDVMMYKVDLEKDRKHYTKVFELPELQYLTETTFKNAYAYGGGFPKLESFLKCSKITVYDIVAKNYEQKSEDFRTVFGVPKTKVKFTAKPVDAALVAKTKYKSTDVITFVHFLEHLQPDKVIEILDIIPSGVTTIIYQPEVTRATHKFWPHFLEHLEPPLNEQHISMFSKDTYLRQLEKYNATIHIAERIDEDFIICFVK